MKIGLALGGGGAKGFFHIGVLRVLESLNIKIDYIAGTSMGALVGALYALYSDVNEVERIILGLLDEYRDDVFALKKFSTSSDAEQAEQRKVFLEKSIDYVKKLYLWNLRMVKPYLVNPRPFVKILKQLYGSKCFEDCQIPFLCSAVDLQTGECCALERGPLGKSVLASCSLPGVFPPVKLKQKTLVEGAVLVPIPAPLLKGKVDMIIGVNLDTAWLYPKEIKSVIDVMFVSDRIRYKKILADSLQDVDFLISLDNDSFRWTDFDRAEELIELGRTRAYQVKDSLLKLVRYYSKKRYFWQKLFRK